MPAGPYARCAPVTDTDRDNGPPTGCGCGGNIFGVKRHDGKVDWYCKVSGAEIATTQWEQTRVVPNVGWDGLRSPA